MFSCVINDEVLDWKYKRVNEFTYAFYIGHIYVGQVFNMGKRNGWAAVGRPATSGLSLVNGFINRYYASEYLLYLTGYWTR